MKKILALLLLAACSWTFAAIRLPDGDLISEGDHFVKLSKLGPPITERSYWTKSRSNQSVKEFEYTYPGDGGYYYVKVQNGRIVSINWGR